MDTEKLVPRLVDGFSHIEEVEGKPGFYIFRTKIINRDGGYIDLLIEDDELGFFSISDEGRTLGDAEYSASDMGILKKMVDYCGSEIDEENVICLSGSKDRLEDILSAVLKGVVVDVYLSCEKSCG